MRQEQVAALAAGIGGFAWAAVRVHDAFVLGRLAHTGYPPTWPVDFFVFVIPVLFGVALVLAAGVERRPALRWAAAWTPLIALALFWESWLWGSAVPTGLLGLPGLLLLGGALVATAAWPWAAIGALTLAQPIGSIFLFNWGRSASLGWSEFPGTTTSLLATQWDVALAVLVGIGWVVAAARLWRRLGRA